MVIVSYHTRSYRPIAELTVPRLREYCARHRYLLQVYEEEPDVCPMWHRFNVIRRAKEAGHYAIVWMDIDCWVLDLEFDLSSRCHREPADYLTALDRHGLCDCLVRLRNTDWTWRFIDALELCGNVRGGSKFVQQSTKELLRLFPALDGRVASMPGLLADPDVPNPDWAFLYHAWADAGGPGGLNSALAEVRERAKLDRQRRPC